MPVAPVAERFERLEETLQICLQMWSDDNGPYEGRHYQLAETLCVPPAAQPAPPADPDRRRRREEDAAAGGPVRRRLQPVRQQPRRRRRTSSTCCAGTARPRAATTTAIEKTVLAVMPALADVDAFLAAAREYAALGVTELEMMPDRHPVEFAEQIAEQVLPGLANL